MFLKEKLFGLDLLNLSILQDRIKYILKNVTVEPVLGCYIIGSVLANLATQNLNLEKACRVNLNFSDEVCTALGKQETANYSTEEIEVQKLIAGMLLWKTFLQNIIPAILILFVGAWSDSSRRRKPALLIPIVGEFLTCLGLILCTYFFYQLPVEVAGLTEAIFPAVTGGWMTLLMASFSYIGDITSHKTRTLRIGIANMFCSVGIPIGTALSGILYKELGSYGVYTVSSALYISGFMYGLFAIPESRSRTKNQHHTTASQGTKPVWHKENENQQVMMKFFSVGHIKESLTVAFKDDGNHRRTKMALLLVIVFVIMGPMHGEMNMMYLFTRRRFNWNEIDYSIFSTYMMVSGLFGTMFSVGIFSHVLQINDALIGAISCVSKILATFVYTFADSQFLFYLAPLVDIISGTSFIAMRSITSKLVAPGELGKVNSLFGVFEAMVPLIYGPLYSYIYEKTVDTMPGAFFLAGGIMMVPAVFIFSWMYVIDKREKTENNGATIQISTLSGMQTVEIGV